MPDMQRFTDKNHGHPDIEHRLAELQVRMGKVGLDQQEDVVLRESLGEQASAISKQMDDVARKIRNKYEQLEVFTKGLDLRLKELEDSLQKGPQPDPWWSSSPQKGSPKG